MIVTMPAVVGSAYGLAGSVRDKYGKYLAALVLCGLTLGVNAEAIYAGWRGNLAGDNRTQLADIGRQLTREFDHDAVILSRPPFTDYLGVRSDFRLCNLQLFRAGYAMNRFRNKKRNAPRRQKARTKRFRNVFAGLNQEDLNSKFRALVGSYIAEGRQVVVLTSPSKVDDLMDILTNGFVLKQRGTLDFRWEYWRRQKDHEWGIYAVKKGDNAD